MSGSVNYEEESGKCAYEAYRVANAARSESAERLPDWSELPNTARAAWIAAAEAVEKRATERSTKF